VVEIDVQAEQSVVRLHRFAAACRPPDL